MGSRPKDRSLFLQIMEMQDLGTKLKMVVMAHRRITIIKKHEEQTLVASTEQEGGQGSTDAAKLTPDEQVAASGSKPEVEGLVLAETENLSHEPFETTDEVKALTQEIIKTIRDIIVRTFFALDFRNPVALKHKAKVTWLFFASARISEDETNQNSFENRLMESPQISSLTFCLC